MSENGNITVPLPGSCRPFIIVFNFLSLSQPGAPKVKENCRAFLFTFWPAGNFFSLRSLSGARPAISFHSGRAGLAGLWEDEDCLGW